MKRITLLLITLIAFSFSAQAQNVNIPDANFKAYLVGNAAINTSGDGEIQVSEASAFTGGIAAGNKNISDLTGIEAFTEIVVLGAFQNPLTSIDISQNTKLTQLLLEQTGITGTLDLSMLTELTDFKAHTTGLTAINMANGNNSNVTRFNVVSSSVTCVQVDAGFTPNSNWGIPPSGMYSEACADFTCTVDIPDANFKAVLVADMAINTNGNTEIECDEATAFSGTIFCNSSSISDMTGIESFTNLSNIYCRNNSLTNLDFSNNVALGIIDCRNNSLTSLDFSNSTMLTQLNCTDNSLTSLDFSNNIGVTSIYCGSNSLTNLDISANTSLITLNISDNDLTALDISNNSDLVEIQANSNQIPSIDPSNNPLLQILNLADNSVSTTLDLSNNPALSLLFAQNNDLAGLNIANGNNSLLGIFNATGNSSLTCIQIDAGFTPPTNWNKDATANYSDNCTPVCTVTIPDAIFKAYLVGNPAINTNGNAEIECTEASDFSGTISCNNLGVSDLTGIEAFTSLAYLFCPNNNITTLDLSSNLALIELSCFSNSLTNLNVSQNTALEVLNCSYNSLTNLDVSQNTALLYLICNHNSFNTLDVSQNTLLIRLSCDNNSLSNLDVSQNTSLTELTCSVNSLGSLDVSQNLALTKIECAYNSFTNLDLSQNTAVTLLKCHNTSLSSLDVSQNPALNLLWCQNNSLTSLNIANGNNAGLGNNFRAIGNPNLTCIQIDAGFTPPTGWEKDASASYSDNCSVSPCTVAIPDANFKAALVADALVNTNGDTEIQCSEATAYNQSLNVDGLGIADLTGIETFTSMTQLSCSDNQLTTLDVSGLPQLIAITCNDNQLSALDVTANTNLFYLSCIDNAITSLDVSAMPSLGTLRFRNNQISTIDLSNNPVLDNFDGALNNLSSLDFSNNPDIQTISAFSNSLTSVNVTNTPDLDFLFIKDNPITNVDVTTSAGLIAIDITDTQISMLDLNNNPLLSEFTAGGANLTELDMSNNPALFIFNVSNNNLTNLNVANGNNAGMGNNFTATGNPNLSCIQIDAGFTPPNGWSKDATASYNVDCTVSIINVEGSAFTDLKAFPNPTSDILNLEIAEELTSIRLVNLMGQTIREFDANATQLNLSDISAGIYFLEVANAEKRAVVKLTKE